MGKKKSKITGPSKGIHSAICPKMRKALLKDKPYDVYAAEFNKTKTKNGDRNLEMKWRIEEHMDYLAYKYYQSGKHTWASCVQAVKTGQAPNSNANYFIEIKSTDNRNNITIINKKVLPRIESNRVRIKTKDVEKYKHLVAHQIKTDEKPARR